MKMKISGNKIISIFLCLMLTVAMACMTIGCNGNQAAQEQNAAAENSTTVNGEAEELGEGSTTFDFNVVNLDGSEAKFIIHTDKTNVGEALLELHLIAGDAGDYGLYVKTVNGITQDYDETGAYWAFYVNDEYATAGVDTTEIVPGATYMFKAEK